jgi:hypothetical protein
MQSNVFFRVDKTFRGDSGSGRIDSRHEKQYFSASGANKNVIAAEFLQALVDIHELGTLFLVRHVFEIV